MFAVAYTSIHSEQWLQQKNNSQSNYHENKLTKVGNTDSSVFSVFFGRYSVFFGICNTDVGIDIWKYRDIGSVSVLPTQA